MLETKWLWSRYCQYLILILHCPFIYSCNRHIGSCYYIICLTDVPCLGQLIKTVDICQYEIYLQCSYVSEISKLIWIEWTIMHFKPLDVHAENVPNVYNPYLEKLFYCVWTSEGPDQTALLHSLVRSFTVLAKNSIDPWHLTWTANVVIKTALKQRLFLRLCWP